MGAVVAKGRGKSKNPCVKKDVTGLQPPPPPPAADPRLPLTVRQKFSVVKSWKGINRSMESTGVCMFVKLFEEHETLLQYFEKFRHLVDRDQQAGSLELQEHAAVVMSTLDDGIRALDDLDSFYSLLHTVGASHTRIPGFQTDFFWKMKQPFLESVRLTLGDAYTENMDAIYNLTIDFMLRTLVEGFEKAQKDAEQS